MYFIRSKTLRHKSHKSSHSLAAKTKTGLNSSIFLPVSHNKQLLQVSFQCLYNPTQSLF